MRGSVLGLAIAAATFAGATAYSLHELNKERAYADEAQAQIRELNARIVRLERARVNTATWHLLNGGSSSTAGPINPASRTPAALGMEMPDVEGPSGPGVHDEFSVDSLAMQKAMRPQVRAMNKRTYAAFADELGLSKEKLSQLMDLLTDQQQRLYADLSGSATQEEVRRHTEAIERRNAAEVAELIGAEDARTFAEYQQSLPARQETDVLATQLDGADVPLSASQHKQLTDVLIAERARVPQPEYSAGEDLEKFQKQKSQWQQDYDARVASAASGILSAAQLSALDSFQQAQKEVSGLFVVATADAQDVSR